MKLKGKSIRIKLLFTLPKQIERWKGGKKYINISMSRCNQKVKSFIPNMKNDFHYLNIASITAVYNLSCQYL